MVDEGKRNERWRERRREIGPGKFCRSRDEQVDVREWVVGRFLLFVLRHSHLHTIQAQEDCDETLLEYLFAVLNFSKFKWVFFVT